MDKIKDGHADRNKRVGWSTYLIFWCMCVLKKKSIICGISPPLWLQFLEWKVRLLAILHSVLPKTYTKIFSCGFLRSNCITEGMGTSHFVTFVEARSC